MWLKTAYSKAGKWNIQHTHINISASVLPSAHCSQTNPSSFMSLWEPLLPLIHGGRLSSASTQLISAVSMNIWTGCSASLCLLCEHPAETRMDSFDRWYIFLWGGAVIIVCLTLGEMGTDVFILEHLVDWCSLYVEEMGKVGSNSCTMTLIDGCFGEGEKEMGKFCWQEFGFSEPLWD